MDPLIVGLDLGTTLGKASAFTLDGTAVASAEQAITTYRPQSGWAEQNPQEWLQAIIEVLAKLTSTLGTRVANIQAIGLSSHGPSVIPTDANFQPLGLCPIWQDQRAADLIDSLLARIGLD